jgi:spermidine synthase
VVAATRRSSDRLPRGQRLANRNEASRPPISLSESDGVRYLHFGTEWVQGAMRVARPFALELEYQQQMMAAALLLPDPRRILLLGLGAAALAKFCWRHCAPAHVTAVELAPSVVEVARQWFRLPPDDDRLAVVVDDAKAYLRHTARRNSFDWLLVDLYDSAARGPVFDDDDFYAACYAVLGSPGVAVFNLFGRRFDPSFVAMTAAFSGRVVVLPDSEAGNRIVLAYRGADFDLALTSMASIAADLQARWRLPMSQWLAGLRTNGRGRNG